MYINWKIIMIHSLGACTGAGDMVIHIGSEWCWPGSCVIETQYLETYTLFIEGAWNTLGPGIAYEDYSIKSEIQASMDL